MSLLNFIVISGIFGKKDNDLDILPPPPPFPQIGEREKDLIESEKRKKEEAIIKQEKTEEARRKEKEQSRAELERLHLKEEKRKQEELERKELKELEKTRQKEEKLKKGKEEKLMEKKPEGEIKKKIFPSLFKGRKKKPAESEERIKEEKELEELERGVNELASRFEGSGKKGPDILKEDLKGGEAKKKRLEGEKGKAAGWKAEEEKQAEAEVKRKESEKKRMEKEIPTILKEEERKEGMFSGFFGKKKAWGEQKQAKEFGDVEKELEELDKIGIKQSKKSKEPEIPEPEYLEKIEEEIEKPYEIAGVEEEIQKAIEGIKKKEKGLSKLKKLFGRKEEEKLETPEIMPSFNEKADEVDLIEEKIHKARMALMDFKFDMAKNIYIEIMGMYNYMDSKKKARVYADIKDLYYERKTAEKYAK